MHEVSDFRRTTNVYSHLQLQVFPLEEDFPCCSISNSQHDAISDETFPQAVAKLTGYSKLFQLCHISCDALIPLVSGPIC